MKKIMTVRSKCVDISSEGKGIIKAKSGNGGWCGSEGCSDAC